MHLVTCPGGACADSALVMQSLDHLASPPDLILLDIQMPPQSGLDILPILKAHPRYALIPVIVLSNSVEQRDVDEAYRRQATAYITKAVEFEAFRTQLAALLQFWLRCRLPGPGVAETPGQRRIP